MADYEPYRIVIRSGTHPRFPYSWTAAVNLRDPDASPADDPPRPLLRHPGTNPWEEDENGVWMTFKDGHGESIETCRRLARAACDEHLDAHRRLEAPIVESYTPEREPQ